MSRGSVELGSWLGGDESVVGPWLSVLYPKRPDNPVFLIHFWRQHLMRMYKNRMKDRGEITKVTGDLKPGNQLLCWVPQVEC